MVRRLDRYYGAGYLHFIGGRGAEGGTSMEEKRVMLAARHVFATYRLV